MCSRIRPHHGLCTQFFEGKGYSDAFTLHMREVIEELEQNPEIELVTVSDEICSFCPNCEEHGCTNSKKVKRYDTKVLELTGAQAGQEIYWKDFVQKVKENIIEAGKMQEVCSDCGWADICHREST